jgi:NADP-dependent 3-hydroxy acid dehydrogenase YdfG
MPNDPTTVWFIADASAGLAAALAEAVLAAGQRAVLAARDPERLRALVERHPDRASAVALDVTDGAAVDAALRAAEQRFGRIDVLAASARQRYFGAVEEGDEAALRAVFEENVFAPVNLARRVLPGMRARRAGHVVLLARSVAQVPAGEGFCHAARAALEAMAEALFHEVERFGIGVTLVDPGAGDDGGPAARAAAIADYADLAGRQGAGGMQVDAARAAQAILQAVAAGRGPLRLVLGRVALQRAYDRLRIMKVGFDAWAELAASADPEQPAPAASPPRAPRRRSSAALV